MSKESRDTFGRAGPSSQASGTIGNRGRIASQRSSQSVATSSLPSYALSPLVVDAGGHWYVRLSPAAERGSMPTIMKVRMTSFAPQLLVDDLARSIAYYEKIGFRFGEPWDGFYAIGHLDGLEVHLKESPKNQAERRWRRDNEHLDAASGIDGIEAFYEQCVANGVAILKPLTATAWGTREFYVEDPDGNIHSFGGRPATAVEQ